MFFHGPVRPTTLKHAVYLISAVVGGIMLSFILHALIEIGYLERAALTGHTVVWYGGCALPPELQLALILMGGLAGFSAGRAWWRMVYVERRWAGHVSTPPAENNE